MFFSSKASAMTCGSSAAAWSLYGSAAAPHTSPGEGGLTVSLAGTAPRNKIQSQSQETLFFTDTLFPPLLPSVPGNHNLLLPCIRRINFLFGTESAVLSRRRGDGFLPCPLLSTATNLPCWMYKHKLKGSCEGIFFWFFSSPKFSALHSQPYFLFKELEIKSYTSASVLFSLSHLKDACEGKEAERNATCVF